MVKFDFKLNFAFIKISFTYITMSSLICHSRVIIYLKFVIRDIFYIELIKTVFCIQENGEKRHLQFIMVMGLTSLLFLGAFSAVAGQCPRKFL